MKMTFRKSTFLVLANGLKVISVPPKMIKLPMWQTSADDRAKMTLKLSKQMAKSMNCITTVRISIRNQISTNMPIAFVIHKIFFQI